ncbi:hypothetical protein PR202_ga23125 [Eleusine coracana subsp. coracana]|uniref:Response regulatory domain-containing protein n=1 Tax=Eleusine coracana subsp. coracana TaxID=191504 RepID=A0AAV5D520_ELECO|nr:hypothetical protein PR202_ga23125 [Eleusine coracana subsp. coracana]
MQVQLYFLVTAVEGPEEALKFLDEENHVDLILTDYSMPNMTGYDLLMKVKESPMLKHLPVVVSSTEDSPDIIKKESFGLGLCRCMEGGAKDFIVKPLTVTDVPRVLSHIGEIE